MGSMVQVDHTEAAHNLAEDNPVGDSNLVGDLQEVDSIHPVAEDHNHLVADVAFPDLLCNSRRWTFLRGWRSLGGNGRVQGWLHALPGPPLASSVQ